MSATLAFQLLNLSVLPWWAVWIGAPRSAWAQRAASHAGLFLVLCGVYGVLIAAAFASGGPSGLDFESLRAALSTPTGFLAGWTHYLAFDAFVGAWIVRESRRLDVEARPYLVLALMLGPLGLGAFLVRRVARLRSLGGIGESDLA